MKAYFDTSALVPVYIQEAFSEQAASCMGRVQEIHVSNLTEVEFYSALAKKIRVGGLMRPAAQRVVDEFDTHLRTGVYLRSVVTEAVFQRALDFLKGFATPLRSLDALHLACCAASALVLVTADTALAGCAAHFGVPCELLLVDEA